MSEELISTNLKGSLKWIPNPGPRESIPRGPPRWYPGSSRRGEMSKGRLEAFSDGVFAILITIMVLELKVPHGHTWAALKPMIPAFLTYALSYMFLGIYWNNHHHMLHAA